MLHFGSNLEYYIKTRAIQSICNEMDRHLADISQEREQGDIDMDELAQVHEEYIKNITKLCFLDARNAEVLKMLLAILQITLDFRRLCKHYLCPSVRDDASSSSEGAAEP